MEMNEDRVKNARFLLKEDPEMWYNESVDFLKYRAARGQFAGGRFIGRTK